MRKLPIEIELPQGFFSVEERSGYIVSEKVKRIWAIELDLLFKFDQICKKHGIKYQLGYGTLLGAVRHRGFIPWDDDVDVWMKREEFNKLLKVSNEFQHPYFLQTALSDRKYLVLGARLRNSMTTGVVKGMASSNYNCGIYLDIYPLDGYIESKTLLFLQLIEKQFVSKCMEIFQSSNKLRGFRSVIYLVLKPIIKLMPYSTWNRWFENVIARYTGVVKRWSYVNGMVWRNRRSYWIWEQEIEELEKISFEGFVFPITSHYDTVLRRIYGNYMEYPLSEELIQYHVNDVVFDPDSPYTEYFNKNE